CERGRLRGGIGSLLGGLTGLDVPGEIATPSPVLFVAERKPEIEFHELIPEGASDNLTVRLSDTLEAQENNELITLLFAAGEEEIPLTVELSAVGFIIDGSRSAVMKVKRNRDPKTEEV